MVKSLDPLLLLMFLKGMSYALQASLYLIKNIGKKTNKQKAKQ